MQKIQRQKRKLRKTFRRIIALETAILLQQKRNLLRQALYSKRQTGMRLCIWRTNLRIKFPQFPCIAYITARKNKIRQLNKSVLQTGAVFFKQKRHRPLRICRNFFGKLFVVRDVTTAHHVDPHSRIVGLIDLLPFLRNTHSTVFIYMLRNKPIYFVAECIALFKANLRVCKHRSGRFVQRILPKEAVR